MFIHQECQTETSGEWKTVEELQQKVCKLESTLSTGTALDVIVLKDNNKLTRLYTGMPTCDSFFAVVEYLEPKAKEMIAWNSSKTKELNVCGKLSDPRCFSSMSIANQFFSVLIRLRLGLLAADVCIRFKISESMYSRLVMHR